MKKFVKISLISFLSLFLSAMLFCGIFVCVNFVKYSSLELDKSLILSPTLAIEVYDAENRPVKQENSFSRQNCKIETLPQYVKDAFIAIEDQKFYSHHGLNYKRIAKAGINNLRSHSLKEGASTISQQLIKNTHLSSEKTFTRKIKEVVLTQKLEKAFSKDEILQSYLNAIYFGNNCYGLEEGASYYFSHPASKLSLPQAALMAGIIKSPNKYSPVMHPDIALKRRNLVLDEMLKCKFISEEENLRAKNTPLELNLQTDNSSPLNSYSEAAIDEACKIMNMSAKDIALAGLQIHTYLDKDCAEYLSKSLESEDFDGADYGGIVIDSHRHAVIGYEGKSAFKILDCPRQPGSCIKPLLVYSPALNEDLICPETQILDENLSLAGYNPKNSDGKYHGYVSVKNAVAKSINIPAIKVLSYVGIDKAKAYAESMGINFEEDDNSFALALGGMTKGVTIKQLAQSYTVFPQNGKYCDAKFVEYILDDKGKILYHHTPQEKTVLREDASFLMTDMLKEAASTGTAKALNSLSVPIAAKTGTVGQGKLNKDAWCVAYSPRQVCCVWAGNLDGGEISIAGGNEPTRCIRKYFEHFSSETEGAFYQPDSIVERQIYLPTLENDHILALSPPQASERYKKTCLFSVFNLPKQIAFDDYDLDTHFDVKISGEVVKVSFMAKRDLIYNFFDGDKMIKSLFNESGNKEISLKIESELLKIETISKFSEKSDIKTFKLKKEAKPPKKKWFV